MTKKISIAIDAMGGDNSPDKTIKGIKFFLEIQTATCPFQKIRLFFFILLILTCFLKYLIWSLVSLGQNLLLNL